MVTKESLQARVDELISGRLALPEFSEWLAVESWDDSQFEFATRTLVGSVELILAEYTSGAWSWDEACDLLQKTVEVEASPLITFSIGEAISVRANGYENEGPLRVADAASLASVTL